MNDGGATRSMNEVLVGSSVGAMSFFTAKAQREYKGREEEIQPSLRPWLFLFLGVFAVEKLPPGTPALSEHERGRKSTTTCPMM
jgi:hypothetical protein